jgi:hypothetical protein
MRAIQLLVPLSTIARLGCHHRNGSGKSLSVSIRERIVRENCACNMRSHGDAGRHPGSLMSLDTCLADRPIDDRLSWLSFPPIARSLYVSTLIHTHSFSVEVEPSLRLHNT